MFTFQVREADENDPFRERNVQLLDDFKVSGVNGTRILAYKLTCLLLQFIFSVLLIICLNGLHVFVCDI